MTNEDVRPLDMTNDITRRALLRGIGAVGIGAGALAMFPNVADAAPLTRVMVFSKTAGFRHDSIPTGIATIRQLGSQNGFVVDATEDAGRFTSRTSRCTRRSCGCRRPGTCSTRPSRPRSSPM
jgi:hypothetical protein